MDTLTKHYFDKAYEMLKNYIQPTYQQLQQRYNLFPEECYVEQIDDYFYLTFTYPRVVENSFEVLEQGLILVYDKEQIIADMAFSHGTMHDVLHSNDIFEELSLDSDWSFLQHYTLCKMMFPDYPYPLCKSNNTDEIDVEACFFHNAYVTKRYRQQHIFSNMLENAKEMVLRNCYQSTTYYAIFSLDPDIACYGEDTPKEPYIYSMKDEPARLLNKSILEKKGFLGVKLEDLEDSQDGAKLWFALLKENEFIQEVDPV